MVPNTMYAMYVYTCMYMYVHVCTCMAMYVHVCTCMAMYVHLCTCMYMYVHVWPCMAMYVCNTMHTYNLFKRAVNFMIEKNIF
jgi:hypothetical protein